MALDPELTAQLKRNDDGLFAAVAQERSTGQVLMVAWMDDTALERTVTLDPAYTEGVLHVSARAASCSSSTASRSSTARSTSSTGSWAGLELITAS